MGEESSMSHYIIIIMRWMWNQSRIMIIIIGIETFANVRTSHKHINRNGIPNKVDLISYGAFAVFGLIKIRLRQSWLSHNRLCACTIRNSATAAPMMMLTTEKFISHNTSHTGVSNDIDVVAVAADKSVCIRRDQQHNILQRHEQEINKWIKILKKESAREAIYV